MSRPSSVQTYLRSKPSPSPSTSWTPSTSPSKRPLSASALSALERLCESETESDEELNAYLASLSKKKPVSNTAATPSRTSTQPVRTTPSAPSPFVASQYLKTPPASAPSHQVPSSSNRNSSKSPVASTPSSTPSVTQLAGPDPQTTTSLKKMISFSRIEDARNAARSLSGSTGVLRQPTGGVGPVMETERLVEQEDDDEDEDDDAGGDESSVGSDFETFVGRRGRGGPVRNDGRVIRPEAVSSIDRDKSDQLLFSGIQSRSFSDGTIPKETEAETARKDQAQQLAISTTSPLKIPPVQLNTSSNSYKPTAPALGRLQTIGDLETESGGSSISEEIDEDVEDMSSNISTPPPRAPVSNFTDTPPASGGRSVDGDDNKEAEEMSNSSSSEESLERVLGERDGYVKGKGSDELQRDGSSDSRSHVKDLLTVDDLLKDSSGSEEMGSKITMQNKPPPTKSNRMESHKHQPHTPARDPLPKQPMAAPAPTSAHIQPPTSHPLPPQPPHPTYPYPPPMLAGYPYHQPPTNYPYPSPYPYYPYPSPAWPAPPLSPHICPTCHSRKSSPARLSPHRHRRRRSVERKRDANRKSDGQGGKQEVRKEKAVGKDPEPNRGPKEESKHDLSVDEISERIEGEEEEGDKRQPQKQEPSHTSANLRSEQSEFISDYEDADLSTYPTSKSHSDSTHTHTHDNTRHTRSEAESLLKGEYAVQQSPTLPPHLTFLRDMTRAHLDLITNYVRASFNFAEGQGVESRKDKVVSLESVREELARKRKPSLTMEEVLRQIRVEEGEVGL
ncbi:hypothetical protein HDV00_010397 [Rhizophlyctis rosea]|nr:hypothetical protein HDV00_010397 [Rhizophlyctis rosea]